jgi:hypothetical protein
MQLVPLQQPLGHDDALHWPPSPPWQTPLVQAPPPEHAAHATPLVPHSLLDWLA